MANEFKVKKGLLVDGTGTVLDVQGTQGQLFSVTDSLTGDLFSVSDISGIPILNVNSSGVVSIEGAQVPTGTGTANKLTKWNSAGTGLEDTNISVVVSGATRQYTINGGQTGSGINLLTLNKDTGGASDRSIMFRIGTTQNDIVSDANSDTGELRFRLPIADGTESSVLVLNSNGNATFAGDVIMSKDAGPTLNMNTNTSGNTSKILLHEGTTSSPANGASIRYDGSANTFKIGVGSNVDTTRLTIDRGTGLATFANNVLAEGGEITVKDTGTENAMFRAYATGTGYAGIIMDASNGDGSGSDYFTLRQLNNLQVEFNTRANAGNTLFYSKGALNLTQDGANSTFAGNVLLGDDKNLDFGASTDFRIVHDSSTNVNHVSSKLDRQLSLNANNINITNQANTENMARFIADAEVKLFYDNVQKFQTTSTGVEVSGAVTWTGGSSTNANTAYGWGDHASGGYAPGNHAHSGYIASNGNDTVDGDTTWEDGHYIALGNDGDFRIYHDGSNNHIRNYKHGANSSLQSESSMGSLHTCVGWGGSNGYANLYYNGSQKLITVSGGVSVTGTVVASSNIGNLNSSSDIGQQMEYGDANVATLRCDANRWRVYMGGSGNSQETLTVTETGRVGVKDSSPDYTLDVDGNVSGISIYASHDIAAYSDKRVKKDIETIPNALDKVSKLRGVTFKRTDEGSSDKIHMGVIAQEVQEIIPEVVTARESDGHLSVAYANMVGLLIESVKDLKAEIDELKKCGKCDNCNCKNK